MRAREHIRYLRFFFRHKWYVYLASRKFKHITFRQVLAHDMSKLSHRQWIAYASNFSGDTDRDRYDGAVLEHYHRTKHHWQSWLLILPDGTITMLPMPIRYIEEMICDWEAIGRIDGKDDLLGFVLKNRYNMHLHFKTVRIIESILYEHYNGYKKSNC